jgi:hypothetical protein
MVTIFSSDFSLLSNMIFFGKFRKWVGWDAVEMNYLTILWKYELWSLQYVEDLDFSFDGNGVYLGWYVSILQNIMYDGIFEIQI